jgi:hypothetical protein
MEVRLNLSNSDAFPWPEEFLDVQRERFCPDLCQRNIVMVYYDQSNPLLYQENVNDDSAWEAVLLISKTVPATPPTKIKRKWNGTIHTRHGAPMHKAWWIQREVNGGFAKCRPELSLSVDEVVLAVYRRRNDQETMNLQGRYLACLGGQKSIYCAHHCCPVITAPNKKSKCCCNGPSISSSG